MYTHPAFNPVAVDLGFLQIHWYGLMYLLGFLLAYLLLKQFIATGRSTVTLEQAEDGVFWGAMSLIIGARIGYILFYVPDTILTDPFRVFRIYEGGMSFHGGFIGILLTAWYFCYRYQTRPGELVNLIALAAPSGIFFGRMGNFINQELWGRPTDVPWGMIFPNDPSGLARHPSQLYEAGCEGLLIFAIIYWYMRKPRPEWSAGALFVLLYGLFRFTIEFFREPDAHIGYEYFGWMTRGQQLTLPMIAIGLAIFLWATLRPNPPMAGVPGSAPKAEEPKTTKGKGKKKKGKQ
jgi:phosphatidylglycerol:prolipoprotein diacylglycerol transferase